MSTPGSSAVDHPDPFYPPSSMAWRAILDGASAERAREAIRSVADSLRAKLPDAIEDASLAGGCAGVALLFACLDEYDLGESRDDASPLFLQSAIDRLADSAMSPSLFGGFTGIAWAVEHLKGGLLDPDGHDTNSQIDEALRHYLGRSPWRDDYDLVAGLVGFGVYALESLPRPLAVECIERIVARLEEMSERTADGITWHTAPHLLVEWQRERCPDGYYNLGLAHGVPGVIAFLGQVAAAAARGSASLSTQSIDTVRQMLQEAIRWLLACQLPESSASRFPPWTAPGIKAEDARLAWCYGDAGIAAALLSAARCAGQPQWESAALDIARAAAGRAPETAGVLDAGLCHGAAGVGHIFNRIYQATGEALFREAAIRWFDRALEMGGRKDDGVGGFLARVSIHGEVQWLPDPGLLTGTAGIALAFLSAVAPVEPAWDGALLLSIPSAGDGRMTV